MDAKVFEKLSGDIVEHCMATLNTKGEEYSREGDRLWNFKRAGEKRRKTPAEALLDMKAKHDVSVDDIVDALKRGHVPSKDAMLEKIGDSINYLLLLAGLIEEVREEQHKQVAIRSTMAQLAAMNINAVAMESK